MAMENIGEYSSLQLIGKGTFGIVYEARRQGCEELVALKVVDLKMCGKKDKEHLQQEVEVLQQCQHTNLVQFKESFTMGTNMFIVMELCDKGNLMKYIQKQKGLKEAECISISKQICNGLKYLHDKNIAHRDVKTTNIFLLQKNGKHGALVAKIGDFGLAKVMDTPGAHTKCVGTAYFMSPEMINGQPYDKRTDIWSLGCCAYEMATNGIPYEASKLDSLRNRINTSQVEGKQIPYCYEMQSLITAMMEKEPMRRPDVQQIITFLEGHVHTDTSNATDKGKGATVSEQGKCRPKTDKFAKTWSPGTVASDARRQPRHRTTTHPNDTSGYDSSDDQHNDEGAIVYVAVRMTEEEQGHSAKAKQLQKDISKRLKHDDGEVLSKISNAIASTKHMDNSNVFMMNMEELLDRDMFAKCKCDLMALWVYRTELLKKDFKIAWDA